MSEQQNLALVQEFYAALKRGDVTGLLNTLVGDVRWFVPGPKTHYPAGRAARGREAGHADPRETFGDARCRTV